MMATKQKALVIFSGGMDSTICLYWALKEFGLENVSTISFDYGQRHKAEIQSARKIAGLLGISWQLVEIPSALLKTSSPLVINKDNHAQSPNTRNSSESGSKKLFPDISDGQIEKHKNLEAFKPGVQATFVPARNILFFTIAANHAYALGITNLVTGVCQADYGGYYDCRNSFVRAMQETLNQGLFGHKGLITNSPRMIIHAPLMHLNKKEELLYAYSEFSTIGPQAGFVPKSSRIAELDLETALSHSHTCYDGAVPPCGKCHACHLRARAFREAGLTDPLPVREAIVS